MRQREVGGDDSSDGILLIFLKSQEEMRDTNENTNSRVLYFSIFSMCCLLGLATWQVCFYQETLETFYLIFHHSGFVSEEILQVQETDRIDGTELGGSDSYDDFNLLSLD